jgi:hypothetical protein
MESTLEEAVVLSEEMAKSIELARNIEPKKQKEKSLASCAGEQAEKVPKHWLFYDAESHDVKIEKKLGTY